MAANKVISILQSDQNLSMIEDSITLPRQSKQSHCKKQKQKQKKKQQQQQQQKKHFLTRNFQ